MPQLEVPEITLHAEGGGRFRIAARWPVPGAGPLLQGALRAMADDYGALVFMELAGIEDGVETLRIEVFDADYQRGKGVLPRAGRGMTAPVLQQDCADAIGAGLFDRLLPMHLLLAPDRSILPRRADAVEDGRAGPAGGACGR
jgi:hypothetical protein